MYDWSQQQQCWILSSFYVGYVIAHIPGGVLAQKCGGKWTLSLGIISTAIFSLLTPMVIKKGLPQTFCHTQYEMILYHLKVNQFFQAALLH